MKVKQSDIEAMLDENDFSEAEYEKILEEMSEKGVEIIDDEEEIDVNSDIVPEVLKKKDDEFFSEDDEFFSDDSIKQYFNEISKYPLLSCEEEIKYIEEYKKGSKEAEDILVTSNLRLVVKEALKYVKPGVAFLDLVQDGTIGLINAINKFDPSKKYKLSTYATLWIRKEIFDSIKEKMNFIKIPNYIFFTYKKICMIEKEFHNKPRKEIDAILEKQLSMKIEEINRIKQLIDNKTTLGLSQNNEGKEGEIEIEDNRTEEEIERNMEEMLQKTKVMGMLKELSKRDRIIIEKYFGLDGPRKTFKEIGEELNLSSERVRVLKDRAIKKLRYLGIKDFFS